LKIAIPSDDHAKEDVLPLVARKKPNQSRPGFRFNFELFSIDELAPDRRESFCGVYSLECQRWAEEVRGLNNKRWLTPSSYKFGSKKGFKPHPKNNLGRFLLLHTEGCCKK
jgi:hypothetical protein